MNPNTNELIPVEAIAGKVLTETGELTAVVTILHDRREALERTRLYEQLRAASDELQMRVQSATAELATQNELLRRQAIELEQASRLKSQFLANMSHEFRTPLNAILGYTHMLLQGVAGELPANVKRQLQRIDSNGRHLLTIINEIAAQYSPESRTASIAVSDTGIGIAPENHEKIFEDFRQVDDSPSRQYGGTGLGLAICRRLANALGGRISLQSNLGAGSTFTLTIPTEAPQ